MASFLEVFLPKLQALFSHAGYMPCLHGLLIQLKCPKKKKTS
jgi:hypothetical protein